VTLRNSGGSVHLLADIAGYYVPGTPARASPRSTRAASSTPAARRRRPAAKVGPGGVVDLQVTGAADGGRPTVTSRPTPRGRPQRHRHRRHVATDVRVYPAAAAPCRGQQPQRPRRARRPRTS
jgi:hypothetical protein